MPPSKRKRSNPCINNSRAHLLLKSYISLKREIKVVKAFELQKTIRKLKQEANDDKRREEKLSAIKNIDLDRIVHECFNELGVSSGELLSVYETKKKGEENENEDAKQILKEDAPGSDKMDTSQSASKPGTELEEDQCKSKSNEHEKDLENDQIVDDDKNRSMMQRIMRHKRVTTAINEIREKMNNPKKKRQQKRQRYQEESLTDDGNKPRRFHRNADKINDIFVASLSGDTTMAEETNADEYDHYNLYGMESNKKNRTGQRARKAKAMAMDAKKKGEKWETSVNWRPKKEKKSRREKEESVSATAAAPPPKAEDVANVGKDWKRKEHPSWLAAKREKKSGIAAFAGTKITFD